jgi:hypothetical protein
VSVLCIVEVHLHVHIILDPLPILLSENEEQSCVMKGLDESLFDVYNEMPNEF